MGFGHGSMAVLLGMLIVIIGAEIGSARGGGSVDGSSAAFLGMPIREKISLNAIILNLPQHRLSRIDLPRYQSRPKEKKEDKEIGELEMAASRAEKEEGEDKEGQRN